MSTVENRREVAHRLFAAEFDDATLSYSEGDEERAPNYVVTPTGARVNRLFAVGALTEVESVNEEVLRGRIADPTGVFVTYAGQYQPEAMNFLDRATPPMFVSITGKARTYEPDDSDRVFTSVRPESINEIDAETRDRWVVSAARATLERVATMAAALSMDRRGEDLRVALEARGVEESAATGVALAVDHYGTTEHYLEAVRTMAMQALELVAGEREAVDSLTVAPDETGPDELGPVPDVPAATPPEGGDVAVTEARESVADDGGLPTDAGGEPAASEAANGDAAAESSESGAADGETTEPETPAEPETVGTTESEPSADAESVADEESAAETASATGTDAAETDEPESETAAEPESAGTTESGTAGTTAEPEAASTESAESESASSTGGLGDFDAGAGESESETTATESEPSAGGLGDFDAGDSAEATDTDDAVGAGDAGTPTDAEPAADGESAADAETATPDAASETGGTGSTADADAGTDEMYEMDEDERAEIEAEFGAEFSTGNEVDDPGEADIDVPDADELEAEAVEANAETNGEAPSEAPDPSDAAAAEAAESEDAAADADESAAATDADAESAADADEPAEDVDLEDAVVDVMADLDDGDGADREKVVSTIVDRYGADPDAVDDAIQDALMSGKCYEPNEGTLKSI